MAAQAVESTRKGGLPADSRNPATRREAWGQTANGVRTTPPTHTQSPFPPASTQPTTSQPLSQSKPNPLKHQPRWFRLTETETTPTAATATPTATAPTLCPWSTRPLLSETQSPSRSTRPTSSTLRTTSTQSTRTRATRSRSTMASTRSLPRRPSMTSRRSERSQRLGAS